MDNSPSNTLLIMTDQHRLDSMGIYGSRICQTPHLDQLAHSGVCFANAFTPTSMCTPARASLLTGLWPHEHGMQANVDSKTCSNFPDEFPEHLVPFSDYLNRVGYRCGSVGKWHLGVKHGPAQHGFEGLHYPGWMPPVNHMDYRQYLYERGLAHHQIRDEVRRTLPNGKPDTILAGIYEGPVEGTCAYYLAERTIERLREYRDDFRDNGRWFFLRCDFFGPHLPYYLPESYAHLYDPGDVPYSPSMDETFENKPVVQRHYSRYWGVDRLTWPEPQRVIAMYWGYVTLIDEQVGRILQALDELGLKENTAVFFSADHGSFMGGHRLFSKGPAMYDDTYRIPLIARWPGHTRADTVCDEFVTLVDLMPTILEIAGLPEHGGVDTRSLVPLLQGEDPPDWRQEVFAESAGLHFPYPQRMVRDEHYKLVINLPDVNELYDLRNDPHELHNLIDDKAYRDVRRRLMQRMLGHLKSTNDEIYRWVATQLEVEELSD